MQPSSKQLARPTLEGQRDHALLALLYNTGARVQEALSLCPSAIRFKLANYVSAAVKDLPSLQHKRISREVGDRLLFRLYRVPRDGRSTASELTTLKLIVGPEDSSEPVITVMLDDED